MQYQALCMYLWIFFAYVNVAEIPKSKKKVCFSRLFADWLALAVIFFFFFQYTRCRIHFNLTRLFVFASGLYTTKFMFIATGEKGKSLRIDVFTVQARPINGQWKFHFKLGDKTLMKTANGKFNHQINLVEKVSSSWPRKKRKNMLQ